MNNSHTNILNIKNVNDIIKEKKQFNDNDFEKYL
jgi:hypothetical protein